MFQLFHFVLRERSITAFPIASAVLVSNSSSCCVTRATAIDILDPNHRYVGTDNIWLLYYGALCFPFSMES